MFCEGSNDRIKKTKFYHASPRRFRHGDILSGGHEGGYGYASANVCMTTSPVAHCTIMSKAVEEDWFVYEVEPLEDVNMRPNANYELQTKFAKIIRCVGKAAALSRDKKVGSSVHGRRSRVIDSMKNYHSGRRPIKQESSLRSFIRNVLEESDERESLQAEYDAARAAYKDCLARSSQHARSPEGEAELDMLRTRWFDISKALRMSEALIRESQNTREELLAIHAELAREYSELRVKSSRMPYDEAIEAELDRIRKKRDDVAYSIRMLPPETTVSDTSKIDSSTMAVYGGEDNYKKGRGLGD